MILQFSYVLRSSVDTIQYGPCIIHVSKTEDINPYLEVPDQWGIDPTISWTQVVPTIFLAFVRHRELSILRFFRLTDVSRSWSLSTPSDRRFRRQKL